MGTWNKTDGLSGYTVMKVGHRLRLPPSSVSEQLACLWFEAARSSSLRIEGCAHCVPGESLRCLVNGAVGFVVSKEALTQGPKSASVAQSFV